MRTLPLEWAFAMWGAFVGVVRVVVVEVFAAAVARPIVAAAVYGPTMPFCVRTRVCACACTYTFIYSTQSGL